jgi:hypothetical protein
VKRVALALVLLASASSQALPPALGEKMVAAARAAVGTRYQFGGRLRGTEGIDCLGVVFLAAEAIGPCGWKSFSVYPTKLVEHQELGAPVEGLSPVSTAELDVAKLEVGDVLMLLHPTENPAEAPIAELNGVPVWVWHTGVYSGEGKWLVGDLFAGQVIETDVKRYLADYAFAYVGVFVTRMKSQPAPARCRPSAPMRPPVEAAAPRPYGGGGKDTK